ncbi:MAG: DNA-3-methyladenine glycosylase [Prevotellaceae bacterium]|jgi:DNA-3-methyladenine glycosylase|nr:DNA-3-methyladenine glycosylase [Prevotellaceae bacterium]
MVVPPKFFQRDVLVVAPDLLGKRLVRKYDHGAVERFRITEVEAYRGEEDKACHAAKGRTKRTEALYHTGGEIYVYLIYGMYQMLNFVTGKENQPQAILIRGVEGVSGPGKLTRRLDITADFYGEKMPSPRIWVEDAGEKPAYQTTPRIGVDYAGEWRDKPWRFVVT